MSRISELRERMGLPPMAAKPVIEEYRAAAIARPAPTPAQRVAEATGITTVLERIGAPPITPEGVITFAPSPPTEVQVIAQFVPVLERLGMSVEEPTIAGIEAAIGKQYEAPIHEGVPLIGGMDVGVPGLPDILGGFKDVGKWVLYGGAAIAGIILLSSFLKGRKK